MLVPGRLLDHLPTLTLASEPVLAITDEELEEFPLSRISGALILADRKVAIGDGTIDQVAVVDSAGGLLHRFGRRGRGPGEIGDISGLRRRAEDELVVWDDGRGQLVIFDTAGAFLELVQTPVMRTAQRGLEFPGFLAGGHPIFERRDFELERFEGTRRLEFTVDRYLPDGAFDSALVSIPGLERVWRTHVSFGVQLAGVPHLAVGAGRVFLGHGEGFEIQTWSTDRLERITRIERARRPASRAEQRAARDSVIAKFDRFPLGADFGLKPADIPVRDSFPAFEGLQATFEGGLWLRETGNLHVGPPSWLVLDPSGAPEARILTPRGFTIHDIRGGLVLGVTQDGDGIPTVLLYRIDVGAPELSTEVER